MAADHPITITPAKPADVSEIAAIASEVHIDTYGSAGRGFLVFPMSGEQYAARIARGDAVNLIKSGNTVVGFLCGVHSACNTVPGPTGPTAYSGVYNFARNYCRASAIDRYFVVDQLVISPAWQNHGFGAEALRQFAADLNVPVLIDVLEHPIVNPRLSWWMRQGFRRIGAVDEALTPGRTVAGHDVVTWASTSSTTSHADYSAGRASHIRIASTRPR